MGESFVLFYREKIKKNWKLAFGLTFAVGLLIHMYKFTNTLPGHDSLFNGYSSQNMVQLGRWFLAVACGLSSFYDVPWVIGLAAVFWISLTAVIIVDIFQVEQPVVIGLIGGLLVSYPSVTQTFFFHFTADGYMLAMALAALSVRLTLLEDKKKRHWLLAFACLVLCCGTYQAYVSFAMVLALCYFMMELLENRYTRQEYFPWMGKQLLLYGLSVGAYYLLWQLAMKLEGMEAAPYLGIETVGNVGLGTFIGAVKNTVQSFLSAFTVWNFFSRGLTAYTVVNLLFAGLLLATVLAAVIKSKLLGRKLDLLLFVLCWAILPFSAFIWLFSSPGVHYSVRMEQSLCVLYILEVLLLARWVRAKLSDLAAVAVAALIFYNGVTANIYYQYMHQCYEQTYAVAVEIATHVHLIDDGTAKELVVIGNTEGFREDEEKRSSFQLGVLKAVDSNLFSVISCPELILSDLVGLKLSFYYGRGDEIPAVDNSINPQWPVAPDWEWRFPLVDGEVRERLKASAEVQEMGCWPAKDSVLQIGDTIVVKLSQVE